MKEDSAISVRNGHFAGDDPFAIARDWIAQAVESEPNDPDAIALATVDEQGLPNARMVLMRQVEEGGFVFYTNYTSVKGQEISASGKAAFIWHSKTLRRQIRVRGLVEKEDGPQADAYFAQRSPASRIGAWASSQSQVLESREILEARVTELTAQKGQDPERPPNWGGFRIRPLEIEFWADGAHRLHDRFRWHRDSVDATWTIDRLYP